MQLKSDTSYFISKTVMLSIELLLIYIWKHLELFDLAGSHRAICAIKTQYLNCSKNMKCKQQLYINRKNDLILIMTPEKQDKTLELSKHWSVDSTPARNEMIMKRTYPVKSVKCDKICSNY